MSKSTTLNKPGAKRTRATKHLSILLLAASFAVVSSQTGYSVTTTGSGNWNSTTADAPWPGGTVPALNSDVIIANGHSVTVTVTVANSPNNLTINSGGTLVVTNTLTVNGTTIVSGTLMHTSTAGTKTHTGNVTINNGGVWSETVAEAFSFGGSLQNEGTFTAGAGTHTFTGTTKTFSGANQISISSISISGSYQNNGTLSAGNLAGAGSLTQNANASSILFITASGSSLSVANFDASGIGNTVNYSGANAQTLKAVAYHHLTLSGGNAKTMTGISAISGDLTVSGSATIANNGTLTIGGLLNYSSTGLTTLTGDISGGALTINATGVGSLSLGTGLTHTFSGTWTRTAGPLNGGSSTLKVGGSISGSGGTFNANTGTVEWNATGAQMIAALTYNNLVLSGSGVKTMSGAITAGGDLTIGSGTTLDTSASNYGVTLGGNFINNGAFTANASAITINGSASTQNIAGFTTSGGTVSMTKSAGTATFNGNVSGGALTINWAGGTLDLGSGLTHTFSGNWTRTAGTLNAGSSTLKIGGSVSGSGGTFNANTNTVEWNAAGAQTLAAVTYSNLVLSGSGLKSIGSGTTVSGNLSIAPSGTAKASIGVGLNINVDSLALGGLSQSSGTWGSTSASGATHQTNVFFDTTTGYLTVAAGSQAEFYLNILGNPSTNFNAPSPLNYGSYSNISGSSWITNTVVTPFETNNLRYAGTWAVKNATDNSPITNGTGPQAIFQITTNLTLTWTWAHSQTYLSATSGLYGTVNNASGWYTNNEIVQLDATADPDFHFSAWTGDTPSGSNNNNPLFVTMNQPRSIQANFATNATGPKVWSGTNNWTSPTNWTPVGMPGPNDTAVIGTNVVTLSEPVVVGALIISNKATMVFSNWTTSLTASNVTILGGGTVTSAPAFLNNAMSNRVWFVCTNFLVSSGGVINVDGAGYLWCNGPGAGSALQYGAGGGHGGHGGMGNEAQLGGIAYGVSNAPMTPGSGGGYASTAGSGGGVVMIQATETASVFGVISANGAATSAAGKGGGSGGSINITCNVFSGNTNGLLRANGGNGNGSGSPGGGGRIAVIYNTNTTAQAGINPGVRFAAARGTNGFSYNVMDPARDSQDGTLFFPDRSFISETMKDQLFYGVRVFVPGFTNWAPNSLTLSNSCVMTFGPDGFQLTVSNKLLLADNSGLGVNLVNGELNCGSLVLTNNGKLWVYSGATNASTPDYAALVKVSGDVAIGSNSWIYPYSDSITGGSILFRMSNLTVAAAGGFDANNKGYISNKGPGHGLFKTLTTHGSGAGYGGKGGSSATTNGGAVYGSADAPVDPGSGGGPAFMGGSAATDLVGGMGGGLIRIQASGDVSLSGTLTANAQDGWSSGSSRYGGGGSGGGIFVTCARFTGAASGFMLADGGAGPTIGGLGAGGGGGGRIAVWQNVPQDVMAQYLIDGNDPGVLKSNTLSGYVGTISVSSGTGYTNLPPVGAEAGTQWFFTYKAPDRGTIYTLR